MKEFIVALNQTMGDRAKATPIDVQAIYEKVKQTLPNFAVNM
jgi:hypothetical protein